MHVAPSVLPTPSGQVRYPTPISPSSAFGVALTNPDSSALSPPRRLVTDNSPPKQSPSSINIMADQPTSAAALQPSTTFERSHDESSSKLPTNPFSNSQSSFSSIANTIRPENNTLAPIASSTAVMEVKKKPFDISSLMSPPEVIPYDNFSQGQVTTPMASTTAARQEARGPRMPMSPPVSPMTKGSADEVASTPTSQVKDPILYPRDEAAPSPPQQPLFPPHELIEHRRIVDEHIAARSAALFRVASPPRREHYELALHFKSQVMKHFTDNRKAWLRKERELLVADRKAGAQRFQHRFPTILPAKTAKPAAPMRVRTAPKSDKVVKPQQSAKPQGPRAIRTNPTPTRQVIRVSSTPEPSRRIVAPNREDRDFAALPDYCPPLSSLPDKPNSLKVDWKGAPIDLSGDPNAHLLHPDEVSLAANLRLDCATYLTSKRRIFVRRLECARVGKEFRKTDAQQACKIDVNKASKLWTAFDKVGWLDLKWMRQFA